MLIDNKLITKYIVISKNKIHINNKTYIYMNIMYVHIYFQKLLFFLLIRP